MKKYDYLTPESYLVLSEVKIYVEQLGGQWFITMENCFRFAFISFKYKVASNRIGPFTRLKDARSFDCLFIIRPHMLWPRWGNPGYVHHAGIFFIPMQHCLTPEALITSEECNFKEPNANILPEDSMYQTELFEELELESQKIIKSFDDNRFKY